jgi:hypothetical protein
MVIRMNRQFSPEIMLAHALNILYKILEDISIQEIINNKTNANRDIIMNAISILEEYHVPESNRSSANRN